MDYNPQTDPSDYFNRKYVNSDRLASYTHKVESVTDLLPASVLEIGVGNGITRDIIKKLVGVIKTLDIDPKLKPDFVGSVTAMPFPDSSHDLVLAAEILEHLPWDDLPKALSEIKRVSKKFAVITLPHAGYTFSLQFKLPLLKRKSFTWKLPHFWKEHKFNGQHYWELGKKGFSRTRVTKIMNQAGFNVISDTIYPDDPAHCVFILKND